MPQPRWAAHWHGGGHLGWSRGRPVSTNWRMPTGTAWSDWRDKAGTSIGLGWRRRVPRRRTALGCWQSPPVSCRYRVQRRSHWNSTCSLAARHPPRRQSWSSLCATASRASGTAEGTRPPVDHQVSSARPWSDWSGRPFRVRPHGAGAPVWTGPRAHKGPSPLPGRAATNDTNGTEQHGR
jgi:hypothetical protein